MNKTRLISVLSCLGFMLGATACTPKKEAQPPKPKVLASAKPVSAAVASRDASAPLPRLGPAPAWQLEDPSGKPLSSDQFRGKVVVVDFWATWCPPCRAEIPGYVALQEKYGKDGLVVVGISLDQAGPDVVKAFMEKVGINYRIAMGDDTVVTAFGGFEGIPTTFLIDREGQIRDRKTGMEETEVYEKKIKAILEEKT